MSRRQGPNSVVKLYQSAMPPTLRGFPASGKCDSMFPARRFARRRGDRMGSALQITRTDHTSATLRAFASKCRDGAQVRRLLRLAMVTENPPNPRPRTVFDRATNGRTVQPMGTTSVCPGLGHLRHTGSLQKCLELVDCRPRSHPFNRCQRLGVCQCLGGLVS